MGWVRGQTGEQKRKEKQRKALPGSGRIRTGVLWLGPEARCPGGVLHSQGGRGTGQVTPGGEQAKGSDCHCGQEPTSGGETGEARHRMRRRPRGIPRPLRCCNESVSLAHPGTQSWGGPEWEPCAEAARVPELVGGQASR